MANRDGQEFKDAVGLPRSEHEATDRRLAERLDALETEKVMRRAMELEEASTDATESFSPADLERIAAEIGINPEFVRQAIAEVRSSAADRSRLDAWLIPDELLAQVTMTGMDREQLDRLVRRWMTEYEGLIATGQVNNGLEWQPDQNVLVRARTAMTSGANRMSRAVPGPIQHRVASIKDDEHVLTMSASDAQPLLAAKLGSVLGALVAAGTLAGGVADGEWGAVLVGAPVLGTGIVGGSILGARLWARNMKQALQKSLVGLSNQRVPTVRAPWRRRKKR